jgi:hypothetical protein
MQQPDNAEFGEEFLSANSPGACRPLLTRDARISGVGPLRNGNNGPAGWGGGRRPVIFEAEPLPGRIIPSNQMISFGGCPIKAGNPRSAPATARASRSADRRASDARDGGRDDGGGGGACGEAPRSSRSQTNKAQP